MLSPPRTKATFSNVIAAFTPATLQRRIELPGCAGPGAISTATGSSIWSPAASVGLIIAGLVIEVCFALIAACMVLALVESYLIISMGVLFMAFGGTRWTKDFAISTVRYTVSVVDGSLEPPWSFWSPWSFW